MLPLPTKYKFVERFWRKVDKTTYCWNWTGCTYEAGYGKIRVGNGKRRGAHQVSWVLHFGDYAASLCVLHKCDNPRCVRPNHLFLGTQPDNLADMRAKGRQRHADARGARNGNAKLSEDQVREFRRRWDSEDRKQLALEFGIAYGYGFRLAGGDTWKEVNDVQTSAV